MKNSKRGRPLDYSAYSKAYNVLKKEMKAKGYTMAFDKLTKSQFRARYNAVKNTRLEDIKQGKRKTLGNITRDIVKSQQYSISRSQAKAYQTAIKVQSNKKEKISDIRAGKVGVDWNLISTREHELRDLGWGWARVHQEISAQFFGS